MLVGLSIRDNSSCSSTDVSLDKFSSDNSGSNVENCLSREPSDDESGGFK